VEASLGLWRDLWPGDLRYAYDLTNLATIGDWPLVVTVVDLAWGTSVGAVVSYIAFYAGRWFA
jgi:uncharacterized membrane protein